MLPFQDLRLETADLPAPEKVLLEENALFSTDPTIMIQRIGRLF